MDYLLAVVLMSVVVTDGHGAMVLPTYQLGKQVYSAPIVLYGQDVTLGNDEECADCPMRRNVKLDIHAALKDGGFLISQNDTIEIGSKRNSTEEDHTKIPHDFSGNIIAFVKRINGTPVTYDWYEEMDYSGLHEGELREISGFCGLMSNRHGITYTRCPYTCPEGTFLYNDQCIYNSDTVAANYSDAVDVCEGDGASLASLDMKSFLYFKEYIGEEFFWVDNSYTGPEDDKLECNTLKGWSDTHIQMGGQNNRIVVRKEGFCVPSNGTKDAKTLCSTAASPYIARPYENTAPEGEYSIEFKSTDELYGHCCQEPEEVSPKNIDVDLETSQSVGAAYMLRKSTYSPSIDSEKKDVVVIFEDSGHMPSKGGQVNPYLVYLSVHSEDSGIVEEYSYHPIIPESMYNMSYHLYVVRVDANQDIQNLEIYSTYDCGEEYRGRCFFHLEQFLEDIGGENITKLHWVVYPDVASLEPAFRRNIYDASMLCHAIYDIEPNDNGLIVCDSPVSGSGALCSGVTWILGVVLIGYHFVYKG